MKITENGQNKWQVESDSGNTYDVALQTKLDEMGSMFFRWACTCPSRKYPCKHALAVADATAVVDAQAEERVE